jgi:hypothetical protein
VADEKQPASGHPEQAAKSAPASPAGDNKTVTIIDGSSGKRQDVVIGGDAGDKTDRPPHPHGDGRHRSAAAGEVSLRHDPGGCRRPRLYGLCTTTAPRRQMPTIAIVVGGPAWAPPKRSMPSRSCRRDAGDHAYGRPAAHRAARAAAEILCRSDGALDYPDNDPPADPAHVTDAGAEYRPLRLASQPLPGYVHHTSWARFTATDAVMPIIREAAKRASVISTAPRQQRGPLADGGPVDAVRQGRFHHRRQPTAEIDRTLIKLVTLAKERGLAVGVPALPISIERIAAWTKTLESRGIMLVPLTTAMLKSKSG